MSYRNGDNGNGNGYGYGCSDNDSNSESGVNGYSHHHHPYTSEFRQDLQQETTKSRIMDDWDESEPKGYAYTETSKGRPAAGGNGGDQSAKENDSGSYNQRGRGRNDAGGYGNSGGRGSGGGYGGRGGGGRRSGENDDNDEDVERRRAKRNESYGIIPRDCRISTVERFIPEMHRRIPVANIDELVKIHRYMISVHKAYMNAYRDSSVKFEKNPNIDEIEKLATAAAPDFSLLRRPRLIFDEVERMSISDDDEAGDKEIDAANNEAGAGAAAAAAGAGQEKGDSTEGRANDDDMPSLVLLEDADEESERVAAAVMAAEQMTPLHALLQARQSLAGPEESFLIGLEHLRPVQHRVQRGPGAQPTQPTLQSSGPHSEYFMHLRTRLERRKLRDLPELGSGGVDFIIRRRAEPKKHWMTFCAFNQLTLNNMETFPPPLLPAFNIGPRRVQQHHEATIRFHLLQRPQHRSDDSGGVTAGAATDSSTPISDSAQTPSMPSVPTGRQNENVFTSSRLGSGTINLPSTSMDSQEQQQISISLGAQSVPAPGWLFKEVGSTSIGSLDKTGGRSRNVTPPLPPITEEQQQRPRTRSQMGGDSEGRDGHAAAAAAVSTLATMMEADEETDAAAVAAAAPAGVVPENVIEPPEDAASLPPVPPIPQEISLPEPAGPAAALASVPDRRDNGVVDQPFTRDWYEILRSRNVNVEYEETPQRTVPVAKKRRRRRNATREAEIRAAEEQSEYDQMRRALSILLPQERGQRTTSTPAQVPMSRSLAVAAVAAAAAAAQQRRTAALANIDAPPPMSGSLDETERTSAGGDVVGTTAGGDVVGTSAGGDVVTMNDDDVPLPQAPLSGDEDTAAAGPRLTAGSPSDEFLYENREHIDTIVKNLKEFEAAARDNAEPVDSDDDDDGSAGAAGGGVQQDSATTLEPLDVEKQLTEADPEIAEIKSGGSRFGGGGGAGGYRNRPGYGGGGGGNRRNRDDNSEDRNNNRKDGYGDDDDSYGGGRGKGRGGYGGREGGGRNRNDNDENGDGPGGDGDEHKQREFYIPPEPSTNEDEIFSTGITSGINFAKYDNIPVQISGENPPQPIDSFDLAGFRDIVLQNVEKSGYKIPTPIQKTAIPVIMAGRDLMACAQTGSGKTAAFLLPIISTMLHENADCVTGKPHTVVVSPTRELAIQIFNEARKFSLNSYLKVSIVYGGTSTKHQSDSIFKGCHILICTPGRLLDFVEKCFIAFDDVRFVVLDEADRMLDMGFKEDINKVMNHPTMRAMDKRQNLMFSATFPPDIQRLAGEYLNDYVFIAIGVVGGACSDVKQDIFEVPKYSKRGKLLELLKEDADGTIVFVETKRGADFLASLLSETEFPTTSIHGDRLQRQREMALADFKSGKMKVLIATSVAARGLDIKNVKHVINFDLPKSIDEYVHRIGRTGRVGNFGRATSFFDPEHDSALASDLVNILEGSGQVVPDFLRSYGGAGDYTSSTFGGRDVRSGGAAGETSVSTNNGPAAFEEEEDWG